MPHAGTAAIHSTVCFACPNKCEVSMNAKSASESDGPETEKSRSIDWYSEGEFRTVRVADVEVTIVYLGRKGRRARIAITGPPSASFTSDA